MIKLITIIGARPQIIKAAALSRAIANTFNNRIEEVIVHTGQHYDHNMSQVFFTELGIPMPRFNMDVGSGAHGFQTAEMIKGIETILVNEKPNAVVVYGDTNSTLAVAIAASKIHIPVVHIEAGLRSFNKYMPEEINRILCDHVSTLLFSPTQAGVDNLVKEGFDPNNTSPYSMDNPGVFHCGDVMYDNSLHFSELSDQKSHLLEDNGLQSGEYILSTIHRNDNTDSPERLSAIFEALLIITEKFGLKLVLPLHPRTKKLLATNLSEALYDSVISSTLITIIPPVSFLDMIALEKQAKIILTDSGGVQKEAFFFEKPCVILRPETEWVELVECGAARIVGWETERIVEAFDYYMHDPGIQFSELFGDGKSAEVICQTILNHLS